MKKNNKDEYKIKILQGAEKIRENAGMYAGSVENGPNHLFYEVFDNSIDEVLNGFADKIKVCIHKDFSISVEDNGRGIPVSYMKDQKKTELEVVFTELHSGGKFGANNKNYNYSGGLHGVGNVVVNYLSKRLRVIVWKDDKEYTMAFEDGNKIEDFSSKPIKSKKTGTFIRFVPSPDVFNKIIKFNSEEIETKIREVSYLCRGLEVEFIDEIKNIKKIFSSSNDVSKFVKDLSSKQLIDEPIIFTDKNNNILVDISLQWANGEEEEISKYYTNNVPNPDGGSHMIGFKAGLTRTINNYINSADLPKTMKITLSGDDIREGLVSVVSIRHPSPKFSSQTKEKLVSDDARSAVENAVSYNVMKYLEQNPVIAKKIVSQCINAHKAREAARKAREATRKSVLRDGSILLPGKLADCSLKDPDECELFIVEGNSAGGCFSGNTKIMTPNGNISFKQLVKDYDNDVALHSCYSINKEGEVCVKPIFHPRIRKVDAEVIQLTCDNGGKITCTPDHLFLVDHKQLKYEEASRLFGKRVYTIDKTNKSFRTDYNIIVGIKYLEKKIDVYDIEVPGTNNFALSSGIFVHNSIKQGRDRSFQAVLPLRGKVLNVERCEYQKIMANEELMNIITALGVGIGKGFNISKLRYGKVVISTDADVDGAHIRTLLLTFFFRHMPQLIANGNLYIACPPLYKVTYRGRKYYVKDENDLKLFIKEHNVEMEKTKNGTKYKGIRLQRFKGLGEMMPNQLWETTMDPETRKFLQVTIDDLVEADRIFNLLMGSQVEPRKQYIYENALSAFNIDA